MLQPIVPQISFITPRTLQWQSTCNPKSLPNINDQSKIDNNFHRKRIIRYKQVINGGNADKIDSQQSATKITTTTTTTTTTHSELDFVSSVCDDFYNHKCLSNRSSSSTTMCSKTIQTPPLHPLTNECLSQSECEKHSEHSVNKSKTILIQRLFVHLFKTYNNHNINNSPQNISNHPITKEYSANFSKINANQRIDSFEINDQTNLQQVAILEVANDQNSSLYSSSLSSCFPPEHLCDFLNHSPTLSQSSFSSPFSYSYTSPSRTPSSSSALSIASLFKFFLYSSHETSVSRPKHETIITSSTFSSLSKVLLSLLIFIVSIFSIQAMNSTNFSIIFSPIFSLLSLLLCFSLTSRQRLSYLPLLIGFLLINTAIKVDALGSSQTYQHSMHEVHSMPSSNKNVHKIDSSESSTSSPSRNLSSVELPMLKILGFDSRPNPSRHHKVTQYLKDIYNYLLFLQKNFPELRSPIIALTQNDLENVHHYREHLLELTSDEERKHHRLEGKRQPSQPPRVTLNGPVTSVLSHKMRDHDDHKVDRRAIPIRRKRDTSSPTANMEQMEEQFILKPATNEAHLTFDLRLPKDEHLKGGELRLYRHAVTSEESESSSLSTSDSASMQSSKNNPVYLPLHWSLRWKSEKNRFHSSATIPEQTTPSSSDNTKIVPTNTKTESNEEDKFFQRINIYQLLRPISELHIFRAEHHSKQSGNGTVRLNSAENRLMRLIDSQVIDVRENGWLSFDIFPAASTWTSHPEKNFGLLVTLTDVETMPSKHGRLIVVNKRELRSSSMSGVQSSQNKSNLADEASEKQETEDEYEDWHHLQPLVVTFSSNEKHTGDYSDQFGKTDRDSNRFKREWKDSLGKPSARRTTSKKNVPRRQRRECSRQPLFFDFTSVGWNEFVVAPLGFPTYFCSGSCAWPLTNHHNYTNHATIQGILNSHKPQSIPPPCCVPTDLSPFTLLTVDNNGGVHLRTFANMVVEGCGCR